MTKVMEKVTAMKVGVDSYSTIMNLIDVGVYFVDRKRTITYWNKGAEIITGFKSEEVLGKCCSDNILTHVDSSGENLCVGICPLEMSIDDSQIREDEIFLHHKDGHRVPIKIKCCQLKNEEGIVIGGIEIFSDLSNKKADEFKVIELEKLAMLDRLTQIANRNYLDRELEGRMDEKKRYGTNFGVLFIDVDHFKSFNDTYGHDVGDKVLTYIAKTLTGNARPFDLFGRWGGEEFLGIIRNITLKELHRFANRLRLLVEKSYIHDPLGNLHVTISIGGTLAADTDTIKDILKRADTLLYKSKANGRNRVTTE